MNIEVIAPLHFRDKLKVLEDLSHPERILGICEILDFLDLSTLGARHNEFVEVLSTLPEGLRQDLSLSIKARGNPNELSLLAEYKLEQNDFLFEETGVYLIPFRARPVLLVSATSWDNTLNLLDSLTPEGIDGAMVLLPELITIAGTPLSQVKKAKALVEKSIEQMLAVSAKYNDAVFIVGTVEFGPKDADGQDTGEEVYPKPRNAAYCIRGGRIEGVTYKRHHATDEEGANFEMVPRAEPLLIPGSASGVLICRDFQIARLAATDKGREQLRSLGGEPLAEASFISEEMDSLCVISCWGCGADPTLVEDHDPRNYYKNQQSASATCLFKKYPHLRVIYIVDRPAVVRGISQKSGIVTAAPISSVRFNPVLNT